MGFNSVRRLPYIRTYAQAKNKYENITPIRGDKEKKRPLADRRDKHLHISEDVVDGTTVYRCHCYGAPMVTFYPDDTVGIKLGKHNTAYTREFFMQLLIQLSVYSTKGRTVVTPCGSKDKYVIAEDNELKLKWEGDPKLVALGAWAVVQAEAPLEWVLNKAKANIVRQPYAEFLDYYKGMTSLLKENVDFEVRYANRRWNKPTADTPFVAKNEVVLPMPTLISMFGIKESTNTYGFQTLDTGAVSAIDYTWLPYWGDEAKKAEAIQSVKDNQQQVLALMRSDQPEDTKGDNYYKAALLMLLRGMTHIATKAEAVRVPATHARQKADEFILRTHKEEVLEQKRMPIGKVASTSYASWFKYI